MNARQKVKKLKREINFYKNKVIQPRIINHRDMCRHRAVARIYPDQLQFLKEPRYLDYVAASLAAEFKQVVRANMVIEDHDFCYGRGKIAVFDIYYFVKGGDI